MRTVRTIALILVILGAINWGLVGLMKLDLVATLFGGQDTVLASIVYVLIGLAGVAALTILPAIFHRHHHSSVRDGETVTLHVDK